MCRRYAQNAIGLMIQSWVRSTFRVLMTNRCFLLAASLEGYRKIAGGTHRATLLETEQAWLAAVKPDLVVSDIVPLACAAAAAVGIPCVCISNFSWGEAHDL